MWWIMVAGKRGLMMLQKMLFIGRLVLELISLLKGLKLKRVRPLESGSSQMHIRLEGREWSWPPG